MILVEDPDDDRLSPFRLRERGLASRPQRREPGAGGLFAAEGDLVVERALALGHRAVSVLVRADRSRAPISTARRLFLYRPNAA